MDLPDCADYSGVHRVLTPALIPWFGPMMLEGVRVTGMRLIRMPGCCSCLLYLRCSPYGVVLGSWARIQIFAAWRYARLGDDDQLMKSPSSGLSILGLIVIIGSFNLTEIVEWQETNAWGIIVQPVAFFLFVTAMFAETGRTPFDVAEGESEIVGGFHTEYSSMKFALFFMGEYAHIVIASALIATLFLGGYTLLPVSPSVFGSVGISAPKSCSKMSAG